ncbi:MAG: hypothetical protein AAB368_11260, partial [bacterium]
VSVSLDGVQQGGETEGAWDWARRGFVVPAGSHAIRWTYAKDAAFVSGADAAWVDAVALDPAIVTLAAALDNGVQIFSTAGGPGWFGQTVSATVGGDSAQAGPIPDGASTYIETTVAGPVDIRFKWKVSSEAGYDFLSFHVDGVEQAGKISGEVDWTDKMFAVPAGTHVLRWVYSRDLGGLGRGQDTGWVDEVRVLPAMSLADAVDNVSLSVSTGGAGFWFPQGTISYQDSDAAQSGAMLDYQSTYLSTTITGPALVSCFMQTDSEAGYDYLRIRLDGVPQGGPLSGSTGWIRRSVTVPPGTHAVGWTYSKDGSGSVGLDAAWVDAVSVDAGLVSLQTA